MKKKTKLLSRISLTLASIALGAGVIAFGPKEKAYVPTFATYTNGDAATYYNSIDDTQSGNTLLTALRTLNLSKRQSTVGYSSMGTTPSGQFKYTDYDTNYVQYDSNGQPYGTKISSFYTFTSATSWNREHVWPNSHGGGSGGDAGTPYPDADIHMPRPTISSENSSRGNSFFVEGMNHSSNGWDPYTAGYSEQSRGEAARITFYCTLVNSKLILAPNNTTPSGTDSVTGQSYGSGHTMGNLETLIKWNINYPVNQREKNRNEGAEYLQGNRNAFVDHPEYACKIWGNVNNNIKTMCANASWDTGPSVSISRSSASIVVDDTTMISATSSDGSTISWASSDTTVVTVSSASASSGSNITLTAIGPGTATITARATINSTTYSATCTVTVSSSGGGGDTPVSSDSYTLVNTDMPSSYPSSATQYTADSGLKFYGYQVMNQSGKIQLKNGQGYIYNSDSLNLGTITISGLSGNVTVYGGDTRNPSSNARTGTNGVYDLSGYHYFKISCNSGSVATCTSITVGLAEEETKTLSSISVSTAPTKTTYTAGEYFDPTGLVITRNYSDSTSDTYTYEGHASDFTFSPTTSTALTTSNASVTITYGGKSCNQAITVNAAKTLSSISVSTAPTKTTYTAGEYFDPTGLVIRRNYSDSTYDTYTYANHTSEFTFSPSTSTALTTSNASVTITYSGKSTTQVITVNAAQKTLNSIAVQTAPTKTSYVVDEYFVPTGLVITRNYSDSTSDTYTYADHTSEFSFNPSTSTPLTTSHTSVTITYGGKSCEQAITVTTSGGGGGNTESGSQRVVSKASSSYYESGAIYFTTSGDNSRSASCDAFTMTQTKISGSVAVPNTYDQIRVYANHSLMFIPNDGYEITTIVITAGSSSYASGVGGTSLTNCTKDTSGSTVTLTPKDGTKTIGFQNSTQTQLNYIIVNYEYETSGSTPEVTSISATVSKSYYVGETISKSDITVKDSNNKTISESNFAFANDGYQFTYSDAASGGSSTEKVFLNSVTYSTFSCNLSVNVSRKAYVAPTGTTTLEHTGAEFKAAGIASGTASSYAENQTATVDGVTFNVSGYVYNSAYLSFSTSSSNAPGSLINTTPYSSGITDVTVNGASPDVQLSTDGSTWVNLSSAQTSTTNYYYLKLDYSNTTPSGYVNIESITVTLKAGETPDNIANYIMYEDTNNQCVSKLPVALGYYKNLSASNKSEFQTSDDYVISTARERIEAWASNQGKEIDYSSGDLVNKSNKLAFGTNGSDSSATIIIVVASMSIVSLSVLLVIKKRRLHN